MGGTEQQARQTIDRLLELAGWQVCDAKDANISAHRGVAVREFPLKSGHGFADYLLYVDGKAASVIEAKHEGATLSGVETQSEKYTKGSSGRHNSLLVLYQCARFPACGKPRTPTVKSDSRHSRECLKSVVALLVEQPNINSTERGL